jgi:hypothetical protein
MPLVSPDPAGAAPVTGMIHAAIHAVIPATTPVAIPLGVGR